MKIIVTSGKGEGLTKLSAFDKALYHAGVGNYNLIKLSSVIPPGSEVKVRNFKEKRGEAGHKLYVVLVENYEKRKGKEAWAGLGWVQEKKGGGIFLEGRGSKREEVKEEIKKSLTSLKEYRSEEYGEIKIKTEGIKCKNKIVGVVVCAVYKSEGW